MIASAGSFATGSLCVCGGTFFVNGRCVSCRGLMQQPRAAPGCNNTVAGDVDLSQRQLRQRLDQNRKEYLAILSQLESLGEKPRRKSRGVFTKKILTKVEERFPSRRPHRRQKR